MCKVVKSVATKLRPGGHIWMVVGDSRYAGISIPVADILIQLAASFGCHLVINEAFRSMRTSAQQGGSETLSETLLVLRRR